MADLGQAEQTLEELGERVLGEQDWGEQGLGALSLTDLEQVELALQVALRV